MKFFYFIFSIFLLSLAHLFKIERQKQFIEIYEKPNTKRLLKALSIGYILNMFLPFKLGNIFRVIYPGKKMKNGISFSLATIIIDVILDFFVVTIIYLVLSFFYKNINNLLYLYIIISMLLIVTVILGLLFNNVIKKIILKIAGIFNEQIELKILKTSWFTIISFKDLIKKISKFKLIIYTIIPWMLYIFSYYMLSVFYNCININLSFLEIFNLFYAVNNLYLPTLKIINSKISISLIIFIIYIVLPLVVIYFLSIIYCFNKQSNVEKKYLEILPQVNFQDRLTFLEAYFNAQNRNYYKMYIEMNNDVAIIKDFSAGSNATTILCSKNNMVFFRKYSFGEDAKKLKEQIDWIINHQKDLKLTLVENIKFTNNYCSYDMPYKDDAITCFNYIHTVPEKQAWKLIHTVLEDLEKKLHSKNRHKADEKSVIEYINTKIMENLKKIENSSYIKPLLKFDFLIINGKKYKNLKYFYKYLNSSYLYNIFNSDIYADIHGDFTIENIICKKNNADADYYLIDPNTGNIHNSPFLDYAKFLQSIHGGYEFLMNIKNFNVFENKIDFIYTRSTIYDEIYHLFQSYLDSKYLKKEIISIYFHEIVHWLRLLPYKIQKDKEKSVVFYAGLILVLNDIEKNVLDKYKKEGR